MREEYTQDQYGDSTPPIKRRIIRRVIRRIPKQVSAAENVGSEHNYPASSFQDASPLGKYEEEQIPDTRSEEAEAPIATLHSSEGGDHHVLKQTPKEMILEQFVHKKEKVTHGLQGSDVDDNESETNSFFLHKKQKNTTQASFDDEYDRRKFFSWIPWVVIPLGVLSLVIFGLTYFSGAEVSVKVKKENIVLDQKFYLEKDGDMETTLPLTVMVIEDSASVDIAATESKTTIATASGKVTISNKQKVIQQLIKTTRLEAPDGKIYRIRENIKIPAAVGDKPGTVDVLVYAESAGPDYNKKSGVDFTIPGFKGKPQFQLVTAKSITDIGGGSSGVKKAVSTEAMGETAKALRVELENKLRGRVSREILTGQIGYDSLFKFTYYEPALEASDVPEKAKIVLKGNVAVPTLDRLSFARIAAKSSIPNYDDANVVLKNPEQLKVVYPADQKIDLLKDAKIPLLVSGTTTVVWELNNTEFSRALLNVSKTDVSRVAARFGGIEQVSAVLHPFWKHYFPSNVNDIHVKIVE